MTLSVTEFHRILKQGLGRAILHLQHNDSAPYREVILDACLHNTAFDPQVEGTRAQYIHDVIRLTSDVEFYREQILTALLNSEQRNWDEHHLLNQVMIFAKAGDENARHIIYDSLLNHPTSNPHCDFLIELDGINGLIALVETVWQSFPNDRQEFVLDGNHLLSMLEMQDGIDQTATHVLAVAETNPNFKEFVEAVTSFRASETHPETRETRLDVSYEELKSWIFGGSDLRNPPVRWATWGKNASDDDIILAAKDLQSLKDDDVQKITIFLDIFINRKFPLEPARLINWARQIDNRPIWKYDRTIDYEARRSLYALNALELVEDLVVRNLALELIKAKNNTGRAVALLRANFVEDDWQLIEELTQADLDIQDYHSLGWSVLDVFDAHPTERAVTGLKNLYEFGACSSCRERFVKRLVSLNAVPQWMVEECKYDCNPSLREWSHAASS